MKRYLLGLFAISFVLAPLLSFAQVEYPDPGPYQTGCISINNNLRYRDRDIYKSNEVSTLQDFLQMKGYLNNEPTGYFGLLTLSAVRSFQMANSISATGYVGPITREKIRALTCEDLQEQICCEIYGYGAYMIRTSSTYEMMSRNQCTNVPGYTGGGKNIVNNSYCASSSTPVISSTKGPQSLKINETGTWKILATDRNGGDLSYSVDWGDVNTATGLVAPYPMQMKLVQSSTFTHSYSQAGNYTVVFTVTNNFGKSATASLSVNVVGISLLSSITVLSPNGGETLYKGNTKMITWQDTLNFNCSNIGGMYCVPSNFTYDIYINYYHAPCTGICPIGVLAPNLIATGVSGTAYDWQVGNVVLNGSNTYIASGSYLISVCRSGFNGGYGNNICDTSDKPFTIQ